jgi:hypothetical protein
MIHSGIGKERLSGHHGGLGKKHGIKQAADRMTEAPNPQMITGYQLACELATGGERRGEQQRGVAAGGARPAFFSQYVLHSRGVVKEPLQKDLGMAARRATLAKRNLRSESLNPSQNPTEVVNFSCKITARRRTRSPAIPRL